MATKDKLPSNEAIWSGRKVAVPKALKVKRQPKPQRASSKGKRK